MVLVLIVVFYWEGLKSRFCSCIFALIEATVALLFEMESYLMFEDVGYKWCSIVRKDGYQVVGSCLGG